MSGPGYAVGASSRSTAALAVIAGLHDAERLLHALRGGCAPADLLLEAMLQVQAYGDVERARGWARAVQKQLERAAG